jgi:hypothetical protein
MSSALFTLCPPGGWRGKYVARKTALESSARHSYNKRAATLQVRGRKTEDRRRRTKNRAVVRCRRTAIHGLPTSVLCLSD